DGDLVWDTATGRPAFEALQRRTAPKRRRCGGTACLATRGQCAMSEHSGPTQSPQPQRHRAAAWPGTG
ncbi:hypothetical protein, partial [Streptomyces sp. NPDC058621]|uniref:hypothetical protein n=1 Tax=Streptomyces sp. NPDC058621 TaxID=3346561 RepID=UPI003657D40B